VQRAVHDALRTTDDGQRTTPSPRQPGSSQLSTPATCNLQPATPPLHLVEPPPEINLSDEVRRLRASLEASIAARISSGAELIRALAKERRNEPIPTTLPAVDRLLEGGLARGKMTEIAGRRSSGRFAMAMATLTAATTMGEAAGLVDLGDHFDPQLAAETGIDLRRLLWVRPQSMKQAVASAEMLIATGFSLVIVEAGLHPIRGRRAPDAAWVRLARAAESHGAALLVSTPYPLTGTASEAVVLASGARTPWLGRGRTPRLLAGIDTATRLEKHRRIRPGRSASVGFAMVGAVAGCRLQVAGVESCDDFASRGALPLQLATCNRQRPLPATGNRQPTTRGLESSDDRTENARRVPSPAAPSRGTLSPRERAKTSRHDVESLTRETHRLLPPGEGGAPQGAPDEGTRHEALLVARGSGNASRQAAPSQLFTPATCNLQPATPPRATSNG
jgi:recA bacterial DNA recombination protein